MNVFSLPKDEMASHLGEVISNQDTTISTLRAEVKVLQVVALILVTTNFLF